MANKSLYIADHFSVGCLFKAQKFKADGTITYDGPWFHNLILDVGLDNMYDNSLRGLVRYCNVGTDNTAPATGQNGLLNWIAATSNTYGSDTYGGTTDDPMYAWFKRTHEFSIGTFSGDNLTEVGLSYGNDSTYLNRQLFKDTEGNTTTITVASDEGLRVIFELRIYSDLQAGATSTGSFTLDDCGNNVTVNYTREVNSDAFLGGNYSSIAIQVYNNTRAGVSDDDTDFDFHTEMDSKSESYTSGNFYTDIEFTWNPGTYVGTISSIFAGYRGDGCVVVTSAFRLDSGDEFDLEDTEELKITIRRSWGRYSA